MYELDDNLVETSEIEAYLKEDSFDYDPIIY